MIEPQLYYGTYANMRARCFNSNHPDYRLYGGKGITICKEWLDYDTFAKWALSTGWKAGLTIDRIDNNKNYCPEYCIVHNLSYSAIQKRITKWHWTIEEALNTPMGNKRGNYGLK